MDEGDEFPSDTSDEDYVPSDGHVVSEEECSGEDEELLEGEKDGTNKGLTTKGKRKRRTKRKGEFDPRKRKRGLQLGNEDASDSDEKSDDKPELEQDKKPDVKEKKKADDLWADFMKDVGQTKPKCVASSGLGALSNITNPSVIKAAATTIAATKGAEKQSTEPSENKKSEKVTITEEYDFAGETVKITKEVDSNSKEAKEVLKKQEESEESKSSAGPSVPVVKKPGGLGNVLGKIGKKQKISTLEKSKLDWNNFKKKEGIEDELQIHNRGKDGYIERMSFLERTDYRQFEIERSLRMSSSKR